MKIYVASSWRNDKQPMIVDALRAMGHEVYDFKDTDRGFHWSDLDPDWKNWNKRKFRNHLEHPIAEAAYGGGLDAMLWADACVLVMPCGRSAHLEAGWFIGQGCPTAILLDDGEPELMYKLAGDLVVNIGELTAWAHQ